MQTFSTANGDYWASARFPKEEASYELFPPQQNCTAYSRHRALDRNPMRVAQAKVDNRGSTRPKSGASRRPQYLSKRKALDRSPARVAVRLLDPAPLAIECRSTRLKSSAGRINTQMRRTCHRKEHSAEVRRESQIQVTVP